jgi:hypothetical protein
VGGGADSARRARGALEASVLARFVDDLAPSDEALLRRLLEG